jgi:Glycosyl hydrolase family 26
MRMRSLAAAVVAAATAVSIALPAGTPVAAASTSYQMLFGLNDHWFSNIQYDDPQIGGGYQSGVVGTFLEWDKSTTPSGAVRWGEFARSRGAAPMMDIYPPSSVRLWQISNGSQDRYLRPIAVGLKNWGHPFLFRLLPEMNGKWESYAPGTNGQTATQFVTAWHHVVALFKSVGASNVKFVWNPNRVYYSQPYSLRSLWPGSSYVNWVGVDGYDYNNSTSGYYTPTTVLSDTVKQIRTFTTMKLMVAELGVAPYSGKAWWIANSLNAMKALNARMVVWFDEDPSPSTDWRFDSGPNSSANLSAARTAIHASYVGYAGRVSISQVDTMVNTGAF